MKLIKAYHCIINNGYFFCYENPQSKKALCCFLLNQSKISIKDEVSLTIDVFTKDCKKLKFIATTPQERDIWHQQMLEAGSSINTNKSCLNKDKSFISQKTILSQEHSHNQYVPSPNRTDGLNNNYDAVKIYEEVRYDYLQLRDGDDPNIYEPMNVEQVIRDSKNIRSSQESIDDLGHRIYENISLYKNKYELNLEDLKKTIVPLKNSKCLVDNPSSSNKLTVNSFESSQKYNKIQKENIYSIPKSTSSDNHYQNLNDLNGVNDLNNFFYKDMDRLTSTGFLAGKKMAGCFLIRHARADNKSVLSVCVDQSGSVKHYKIYDSEGSFYLDLKDSKFPSVSKLLNYYHTHSLPKCNVSLSQPCRQ